MLATLGIMIWVPHATSNGAWIGSKILQGFVGAPIESLCEISVTDVYFTHERGRYMGLYAFMLAGSNFLAPVLAGFINDGQGYVLMLFLRSYTFKLIISSWQWVMYWCAIFLAIGFIFCFFFLEETNYDRAPLELVDTPSDTPGTTTPKEGTLPTSLDPEKGVSLPDPEDTIDSAVGLHEHKKKTYLQKLTLLDKKRPFHLFRMMFRPLLFFSLPSVVYAGFSYGSNLVWFNVLNGTASLILSAPPYNFPASMVGLSYVSPLIGVAAGSFYSGVIGDQVTLWLARRNKGILESEHRLWLFAPSLILIPGSLILWGVGAAHHVHVSLDSSIHSICLRDSPKHFSILCMSTC
jgi:hypothetical protein